MNLIEEKIMTIIPDFNGMKTGTGTTGSTLDTTGTDTIITVPYLLIGIITLLAIGYLIDRHINQRPQQE